MTDLGTLGGSSFAYGVNDSGEIVGYSWPTNGDNPAAFLYLNGVMIDLNSLISERIRMAPARSLWHQRCGPVITGEGLLNGQAHAFLLDPVLVHNALVFTFATTSAPEPGNLWLAAFGLVLVWIWGLPH